MENPVESPPCPLCGESLATGAAGGVCAACALRQVLGEADSGSPGRRVGRYRLLEPIGHGGMGTVWLAEDPGLDRLVAVKTLPLSGEDAGTLGARLLREARAVAGLDHPHVVKVFEVGESDGAVFLAMEYVEGGDLRAALRDGAWMPAAAARLVLQAASAVAHAHAAGVLHRDLKPANVLLTPDGAVRLADFGLAAPLSGKGDLTLLGEALGTPAYMAPEVAEGRPLDARVDVYGLGALLYELLTGRPPFSGQTTAALLTAVSRDEPVAPRTLVPRLTIDLETICLKCLQKEPAHRYASAALLEADLAAFLENRPIAARPLSLPRRTLRWARRHPGVALSMGAVGLSLAALAAVSVVAAWRIDEARHRAEVGEQEAREQLRTALIEQARNRRVTRRPGQRSLSLAALGALPPLEANGLKPDRSASSPQMAIDEAVAALALPELIETASWGLGMERPRRVSFDPTLQWYLIESEDAPGIELRRVGTAERLARVELTEPLAGRPLFSPDGDLVVTRSSDAVLRVWHLPALALLLEIPDCPYPGGSGDLRGEDLAFSPDGRHLGVTPARGGYTVYALPGGEPVLRWEDERVPRAAAFSPDGQWLALGNFSAFDRRGTVLVLDASSGEEAAALSGFGSGQGLAWRPNSDELAIAGSNRVDVRDRVGGSQIRRFEVADGPAYAMGWSPEGSEVWAWSDRGRFRRWDLVSGMLAFEWYERTPAGTRFAISSDGRSIVTAGDQWRGVAWEWSPSPVRRTLRAPMGGLVFQVLPAPGSLEFSPDERFLLVTGLNRLAVLSVESGQCVADLSRGGGSEWTSARWGATSHEIWWSREQSGLWHLTFSESAEAKWEVAEETLADPHPGFLVSDYDQRTGWLALAAYDLGQFRLFAPKSPESSYNWEAPEAFEIVFAPDGASVLTARLEDRPEAGPTIAWRNLTDGSERPLPPHGPGGNIRWAEAANRIVAVTGSQQVELWRPGATQPVASLPSEFAHSIGAYAISDDGRWIAAWSGRALALLDGATGELIARLTEPAELYGEIRELRFSPSGRQLAAVRRNGTISLWEIEELLAELRTLGLR